MLIWNNFLPSETFSIYHSMEKKRSYGLIAVGAFAATGVGLLVGCAPFILPALRKICLPFVPATDRQVQNVLKLLKNRKGRVIDLGSGDGRIAKQLNVSSVRHASMIKPPVSVFGVEGRYATALYSAAMKEKKIDAVEKDMKDLKDLLTKDVKLSEFILNPLMKVDLKVDALKKVFAKKNYSALTINLLACMTENGRLKSLVPVINCFNGVMSAIKGEVLCGIVSAKTLDAPTLAEFEKALKKFLQKNEKVILETKVDPSLIGGVVVTIGDKYIDMSIASKIKQYNAVLREIV